MPDPVTVLTKEYSVLANDPLVPQRRLTVTRRVKRKLVEQLEVTHVKSEACTPSVGMQSGMAAKENSM